MAKLFQRKLQLIVGDLFIEGLDAHLSVKKTSKKEPNTCDLEVYNLKKENRGALQSKGTPITIVAGYEENLGLIFSGDSRTIDHIRRGPDWVTKIQCGDGERTYNYSRVVESFAPGTKVADVFAKLAELSGLEHKDAVAFVRSHIKEQFVTGYTAFGKLPTELDNLLNGRGLEWSIQDGRLQVVETDRPASSTAVLLTPNTGLIGSPEHGSPAHGKTAETKKDKSKILKVKSLLNHQIRPGALLKIQCEGTNGLFKVEEVVHVADTTSNDWYSDAECSQVEETSTVSVTIGAPIILSRSSASNTVEAK